MRAASQWPLSARIAKRSKAECLEWIYANYPAFRRRADAWKLIHYVEAPLAPTIYLRRALERSATPGFPGSA